MLPALGHADRLPAPQQTALLAAFGMTEAAAPDRFLIALAVLELLSDAAERAPLMVVADDAQWLDHSTADVLTFVARRVEHEPIGVLVASRDGVESFFDDAGLPEQRLAGLDDAAAESLLDAQAPDLASAVREQLLDEAKGNPLALVELPVAWDQVREGTLLMAQVPLTTRLEQAFATRIVELPTITQTVLLVAALNDGESLSETLEAASGLVGRELTVEHVAPAVSAQFVGVDETGLRFRHPLVRTVIHQAASMSQRLAAHAALAAALAGQPDRSVWHRAASIIGPDEEVASELEAAATRARRRRGIVVSVAALERAAQLTDAPARRGGRLLRAAELAFEQGRHDVVVRLLNDAEPLALDSADRTRLLWLRELLEEHLWSRATRVEDSVALAEQIQRDGASDRALDFLMTAALKCWRFNPLQETRDLVVAAAEGLPIPEDDPKLLATLAFADPVRCGGVILQRIAQDLPTDVRAEPEAMRLLGTALTAVGAFDRSTQFLATSTDDLRAQGRLGLLARSLVSQAWSAVILGTFTDADPAAEEAERLARETEQPRWAAGAQLACATLAGLRGEADVAEALAAQAERVLLPTGSSSMLALVQIARGVTALGAGHFEDAYEHLRRVFDPADIAFHPVERSWVLLDLVDAAVHSGHHDEARALVGELEPLVAQTRSPVLQAELNCAQPLLADHAVAEARFERALGADLAAWPFSRARLLLAYGAWLRRQRRVGESRVPLRTAREAFDALGVPPWVERARHELRGAGVTSRPRERHAMHKLTPKELQIARMAASGLSNREIGQQLYLSHRTVGAHLYRAFPKLGITSRGQLRDALDTALP